jgi:hypothetical protein
MRSTPTLAQVIRRLGRDSLPASVATTVARRELAVLRKGKLPCNLKKAISHVRGALRSVVRAQRASSVNGTGVVIATDGRLSRTDTGRKTTRKALRNELHQRAARLKLALEAMPMKTSIGPPARSPGRMTPRGTIQPVTLDLLPLSMSLKSFATRLRSGTPAVFGYVEDGRFRLDLRTINPSQDEPLFRAIYKAFGL